MLMMVLAAAPIRAESPAFGEKVPLEQLLNEDGTLNLAAGFTGTLDPAGYRMVTDTDGAPRFVAEASCNPDESWDDRFWPFGVDSVVRAIAINGTDVYVGGDFVAVSSLRVDYIARWDGTSWLPPGSGIGGTVKALAAIGTDLYAGGFFGTAGGKLSQRIARWEMRCGNGIVEAGEQCDDCNLDDGDCCSSTCQFAPAGTPCNDGLFCNGTDTCNGAGACSNHSGDACVGGPQCNNTCNELADNCLAPDTTPCNDGTACTTNDM